MTERCDAAGQLLPDTDRLTAMGKILRKSSLDEMPQLINVLKGEMSFVGPRPLLPEYLELYKEEHRRRHLTKPGITGWAQINGRNLLSWEEKFNYDVEYVDKLSSALDAKIMFLTVPTVLLSRGVNANDNTMVEAFKGNIV